MKSGIFEIQQNFKTEGLSEEFAGYYINFMHPHGPASLFYWPSSVDKCWIDINTLHATVQYIHSTCYN